MSAEDFAPQPSTNGHAKPELLRLNLGAGTKHPLPGYQNLDRKTGQEIFPLAYADNSVDEVRASHVLEHFCYSQIGEVLAEWVRVLKPGGVLKIAVPDFEYIARAYLSGEPVDVQRYTMGGHLDDDDFHKCILDREELARALRAVGVYDIRPWKSEIDDCASLPVSLNLSGRKKKPLPPMRVGCAMSVPRLGFMDNFFCWVEGLLPFGIRPQAFQGAFWGPCLERTLEDLLDTSDWILTVDYDSVFTRDAVEHLMRLAEEYPAADAIAPLQIRRGADTLLMTLPGPDGQPVNKVEWAALEEDLTRANSAHFGLTLLRADALRRMAHPWFLGVPAPDGRWREGRQDDDTYFWRKWAETGNTLFLAPHIVVAHGQFMLTWPDRNLKPIYQHPGEFREAGPPEGVWQ